MADEGQTGPHSPDWPTPEQWRSKRRFQRKFRHQAIRSYIFLCIGMGVVALVLPVLLTLAGGDGLHRSISHYYHASDTARNILVGSLWATGTFLIMFQGLSWGENWTLNMAGLAAISVAMNPIGAEQVGDDFDVHAASAIIFFACLAIVAIFFSKRRLRYIIYPPKRRFLAMAYTAAGMAMIGMPALIAALQFLGKVSGDSNWIFWVESVGIWAFAFYWFVKTHEYRLLLRIR